MSMVDVKIENVELWRSHNTKALEQDIGHPNLAASLIRANETVVPAHNVNHDEFVVSLEYFLLRKNLGHWMTNSKCFVVLKKIRSHNARPTNDGKLIIENKLGIYEFGASCILKVKGGYGEGEDTARIIDGQVVRFLEFIFDTSNRYESD